ncbi:hypothetical protein IAR50_004644 [Cryptococcus sp. DSM 104548]
MPPSCPSAPFTPAASHSQQSRPVERVVWKKSPLDILADAVDILDQMSPPRVQSKALVPKGPRRRWQPHYHDPVSPMGPYGRPALAPRIETQETISRLSRRLHSKTTLAPSSPPAVLRPTKLRPSPEIRVYEPIYPVSERSVSLSFCDEMGDLQLRCSNGGTVSVPSSPAGASPWEFAQGYRLPLSTKPLYSIPRCSIPGKAPDSYGAQGRETPSRARSLERMRYGPEIRYTARTWEPAERRDKRQEVIWKSNAIEDEGRFDGEGVREGMQYV